MNCSEFENLLADAWGDELATADRPAFDSHLASCARCRTKYEEGARALGAMRSLEAPRQMVARRDGDRLVIQPIESTRRSSAPTPRGGWFRLAASVAIAFTAGYGLHAGLMIRDAIQSPSSVEVPGIVTMDPATVAPTHTGNRTGTGVSGEPVTLQSAIASAYNRGAVRSDFAACMMVISRAGS